MSKKADNTAAKRSRKFILLLFTAAAAAFLLRLFAAYEMGGINGGINSVFTPSKATDLCTYMVLAEKVAAGKYEGVFYYQPFYYAVFLPAIRILLGAGVWKVIIIQSLLGGATAFLAGLSGARIFGRKAGIFAAWMTAVSVPLILYAPFHQNETLQTFNITLIFYLALLAVYRSELKYAFFAGLFSGIGILTRGNLWLILPALLLTLCLAHIKNNRKLLIKKLLIFLLPLFLIQLPFVWHNTRILGKLTGPSTAADAVLALGNTWEAPAGGRNIGLPAGPMEYPEAYHRAMALASNGISVPRQMLKMLADQPGAFLELQFRKLLLFWSAGEIPNNVSLYGEGQHSFILRNMYPGSSALLLALGIAGMLMFIKKLFHGRKSLVLLYGFILLYWGAIAAFYILSRFRAPIIPLVTVSGGGFLAFYLKGFFKDKKKTLNAALLLLFSLWLSVSAYDTYRSYEHVIMRFVRPDGTILPAQENYPEVRFDYGPFSFGNWTTGEELKQGTLLVKNFTAPGEKAVWSIAASTPGELICRAPGFDAQVITLKSGLNEVILPVSGSCAQMEILSAPPETCAVFDTQRRYSRSFCNNQPVNGEWIVRLQCSK